MKRFAMTSNRLEAPTVCKICNSGVKLVGSIDANKCCLDRLGKRTLPISDVMVPYYSCNNCGFIFTSFMDNWTPEDFKRDIYNDDYIRISPPIPGRDIVPVKETPSYEKGLHIAALFDGSQSEIRVLDFGAGGNPGPTGQALIDKGFQVHSYEPYRADCAQPDGKYDLIICIEVLEHCHDLKYVTEFMKRCLSRDGMIWVQTLVHPHPAPDNILSSWYISPRDGHVSIHTSWSLTLLFNSVGMNFVQTARGMFAFRRIPTFRNQIFLAG
jgi:hypothetical protein